MKDSKNRKPRNKENVDRDVLIADTAIKNKLTLVTDDKDLREVVQEVGGSATSFDDFMR